MLMTAGLGTRLRPFTLHCAKPLLPLMGIPLVQFAIDRAVDARIKHFVANIHHLSGQTSKALVKLDFGTGGSLRLSDESSLILGSAGGLKKAAPFLGECFVYLNGDVLCNADLNVFVKHYQSLGGNNKLLLGLFKRSPGKGAYREILVDAQLKITGLGFANEPKRDRPFFMGLAIIPKSLLEPVPLDIPSEFVPKILEPAIQAGLAHGTYIDASWFDIGSGELWHATHLQLLSLLEAPHNLPVAWVQRILENNLRVKERVWVSKQTLAHFGSKKDKLLAGLQSTTGGFYLGPATNAAPLTEEGYDQLLACIVKKKDAILYPDSKAIDQEATGPGIGFNGHWLGVAQS